MPEPDAINDYIEANRGSYTDQAIRENLVAAGHDPAAIDEALARLGAATPPTPAPKPATGLVTFAWFLFAFGGVVGLAGFGMGGYFIAGASVPLFLLVFGGIGFVVILLLSWAIPHYGIQGTGAFWIGLVLAPFYAALLYGGCAAAMTTRA